MGEARQISGADSANRNAKAAGDKAAALQQQQLDLSRDEFDWQKGVTEEQRDYARGLLSEDRGTAAADYTRRLGLVTQLEQNADFSPDYIEQQVGGATATVRSDL